MLRLWRTAAALLLTAQALETAASTTSQGPQHQRKVPHVDECNFCQRCHRVRPATREGTLDSTSSTGVLAMSAGESATTSQLRHRHKQKHRHQHHKLSARKLADNRKTIRAPGDISHTFQGRVARDGGAAASVTAATAAHTWEAIGKAEDLAYARSAAESGIPGVLLNPNDVTGERMAPDPAVEAAKKLLPNCTECYGCTARLAAVGSVKQQGPLNVTFEHEPGSGGPWVMFAKMPHRRRYVVKILCMPYSKFNGSPQDHWWPPCWLQAAGVRIALAVSRLSRECGLQGVVPRMWVAPVNAVIPDGPAKGFHVRWYALWQEEAEGITVHALSKQRALLRDVLAGSMLNRTQVVELTVLDLLTATCDRHSQNLFITREGNLRAIDNDSALGLTPECSIDSMLLPGTRYHSSLRTGWRNLYLQNRHNASFCTGPIDPRVLLDYRCYVPNGQLGVSYPPGLATCLRGLAGGTIDTLMARYGLPWHTHAAVLQKRASDLITQGFESTVAAAASPPANRLPWTALPQPPCCELATGLQGETIMCAQPQCWKPVLE